MSLLNQFLNGSLVSSERLMRAREFYAPSRPAATEPILTFRHWAERASVHSELACARELAGLSNSELETLESEFVGCQQRPAPVWVRSSNIVGLAMLTVGILGFGGQALADLGAQQRLALQLMSLIVVLAGLVPLTATFLRAFSGLQLDLSHGVIGLYVGQLNEQHPWLYKALRLTRHEAGEDYRRRTLEERGPLRGVDYILMREVVRMQESLEELRPARTVAEELQRVRTKPDAGPPEPRLVSVTAEPASSRRNR